AFLRSEIHHLITALKDVYCDGVREFGRLTREQKKQLPVLKALDLIGKEFELSLRQQGSNPLEIARRFSEKIQQFCIKEILIDSIDQEQKCILKAIVDQNDAVPTKDQKKLLRNLKNQRLLPIKTEGVAPYKLAETLRHEFQRIDRESEVFKSYITHVDLDSDLPDELRLDEGICGGSVTNFIRLRLMGAASEAWMMWPSQEARFFQTTYTINDLLTEHDGELATELDAFALDFLQQKSAYKEAPAAETFKKCTHLYSRFIQLATRRLGQYANRKTMLEKASDMCQKAALGTIEDREKVLAFLEIDITSYQAQIKEWHQKCIVTNDTDVGLLRHQGIHLERLLNQYVNPADLLTAITALKEKVDGTDGHVKANFYYLEGDSSDDDSDDEDDEEDGRFIAVDSFSLAFYEKIQKAAAEIHLGSIPVRESPGDKEANHIDAMNWIDDHISKPERQKLSAHFNEKYSVSFIQEVIERAIGKKAPEAVVKEMTLKLMKKLESKVALLKTAPKGNKKKELLGHSLYLKLTPPYEIRDPNSSDFLRFKTNDYNEFLFYL
ncbi:MAG TPA: hypothetical protein VN457_07795, partial [Chlamydiales bacterium]|nr:hypothetical protein [Chlamydiales bacterium]